MRKRCPVKLRHGVAHVTERPLNGGARNAHALATLSLLELQLCARA